MKNVFHRSWSHLYDICYVKCYICTELTDVRVLVLYCSLQAHFERASCIGCQDVGTVWRHDVAKPQKLKWYEVLFSIKYYQSFCSYPTNNWLCTGFTVHDLYLDNKQAACVSGMLLHYSKNMALPWLLMAFHSFSSSLTDMSHGFFKLLIYVVVYCS